MENQRRIQEDILKAITSRLAAFDFVANSKRQLFCKVVSAGRHCLHVSFIPHNSDTDITADVAIRIDEVEELLNDLVNNPFKSGPARNRTSFTFGANLGHIAGGGQIRWTVFSDADIHRAADEIASMFFTVGIPYLQRYSDVNQAYDALLAMDNQARLLNAILDKQAVNAVVLAYLRGSHSEFSVVSGQMADRLRSIPNSNLETFLKIVRELEWRLLQNR